MRLHGPASENTVHLLMGEGSTWWKHSATASACTVPGSELMPKVMPMKMEWKMMPASKVSEAAVYIARRCSSLIASTSSPLGACFGIHRSLR